MRQKNKMKVIFFGTPQFAANILDYLFEHRVQIVAVVSKPDRAKGRSGTPSPTPVKLSSQSHDLNIPVFQPELVSSPEFAEQLKDYDADFFVVVAYGEIIKQFLLDLPKVACLNVHASLLPKYRGAAPIQRAIIEGETETGITVMHMVKKMDAGDMILSANIPIRSEATFGEIEEMLCEVSKEALLKVLEDFETYDAKKTSQDITQITFAPKIELEDCEINWDRPAQELHNLVRGVNPYPGAWCYVEVRGERKRLKINRTHCQLAENFPSKTILNPDEPKQNLIVKCGQGALELLEVQLEGKKRMSSEELTRGISRKLLKFL